MKALVLHANRWASTSETRSVRTSVYGETEITGVLHEEMEECLVVLFQVEAKDTDKQAELICTDVGKMLKRMGVTRLVVEAFDHLSHSQADACRAKEIVDQVVATCRAFVGCEVKTSPFGWDKALMLDIKGHQGAFNHRSY